MQTEQAEFFNAKTKPKVLVVGDIILDRYVRGKVDRISPEAPIQIINAPPGSGELRLGGAANVAANVSALGGRAMLAGAIGTGSAGRDILRLAKRAGIATSAVVKDRLRPTTEKTRLLAGGQQVVRIDREDDSPIPRELETRLIEKIKHAIGGADAVVISDYAKGVLTERVLRTLIVTAKKTDVPVICDPKGRNYKRYKGVFLITPNRKEAFEETGIDPADEGSRKSCAAALKRITGGAALITLGSDGMYLLPAKGRPSHLAARARQVYDVTGAGDTVCATLAYTLAAGGSLLEAASIANTAGGLAVEKIGAVPVTRDELKPVLAPHRPRPSTKVKEIGELSKILEHERKVGKKIVFTNGCFDIIHVGHIRGFAFAKSQGDILVIGLNSDSSVKKLKGPTRPILNQKERAEMLAALEMVDYVTLFSESTPYQIVKKLQPDILAKGADWKDKGVIGQTIVEKRGGRVELIPLVKGISTSKIIEKIKNL